MGKCIPIFCLIKFIILWLDIIGLYRPPSASVGEFLSLLERIMNNIISTNDLIIMGDFNINGLIPSSPLNNYLDLMSSFALLPHIDKVTRPNTSGKDSLLDIISGLILQLSVKREWN